MISSISKKNIEDSLRDEVIITIGATGIFFGLKAVGVKLLRASLNAMDIMTLTGLICGGTLMKDCSLQKMDQRVIQQKIL